MSINIDYLFPRTPAVIAHRGANRRAPENTLAAFRKAVALGADAIELDTMLSKDGVAVVIHDATLERTTDGLGCVREWTAAALAELDAGSSYSPEFRGERIPTLAQTLEEVGPRVWVNVELKDQGLMSSGLEERVVAIVRRMGMNRRVLLSSFNPLSLWRAARLAADIPRALLTAHSLPLYLERGWLAFLAEPQAWHAEVGQVTASTAEAHRRRGQRVTAWTVNTLDEVRLLAGLDVDGIITDVPEVVLEGLGRD